MEQNELEYLQQHPELCMTFARSICQKHRISFEPSMVGQREYDFCAVGIFITQGNSGLFREFLSSYGYADSDLTDDLRRRIMMWLLLHRYSNLSWFLTLIPGTSNLTKLEELEQYWFGSNC